MLISVVIPAFNEEKLLPGTLQAVRTVSAAFAALDWETEIVVCDNNSTDATAAVARQGGARVVVEPVNQIARARNAGAAAATGDWLIFVDADSCPSRELFADVAREIQGRQCLAGGATMRFDEAYVWARAGNGVWNLISRTFKYMAGGFIFCEAKAFREVGGFSQDYYVAEEIILSRRLKRLAKTKQKRVVILRNHPVQTSGRKLKLYTPWEHIWFLTMLLLGAGRRLRSREHCHIWYDGKR